MKNWAFKGGGVHETPIQREGLPKKGAWTVCRFKGGLARKRGVMFLRAWRVGWGGGGGGGGGGLIPQYTL